MRTFSYFNAMEWSIKIHPWNELGRSSLDVRRWEYFHMNNRLNLRTHPLPLPLLFILTDFSKDSIKPDVLSPNPSILLFCINSEPSGRQFKNVSQSPNSPLFTFRRNTQNMDDTILPQKCWLKIKHMPAFGCLKSAVNFLNVYNLSINNFTGVD